MITPATLLGLGLAVLMGLSLGLLGGGGSTLAVPILVYVLGYAPKQAIAMSLAIVGVTSLAGAVGHWRAGHVRGRIAVTFGVFAMAGSFLGARLATLVSGSVQLVVLAVVMLVSATLMLRSASRQGPADAPEAAADGASHRRPLPLIVAVGVGVGLLTGLVGIGGGFLIVPALVLLAALPIRHAIGTSLLVIAMNATAGFVGYLGQVEVPWGFMAIFVLVAISGILAGTRLVRQVPQAALKRLFAVFLVLVGGYMLYRNRGALLNGAESAGHGAAPGFPGVVGAQFPVEAGTAVVAA